MKLSIIIPVLNEQETIEQILEQVMAAPVLDYEKEIIIVNDGSTDRSGELLKGLKEKFNFIFLEHSQNLGKGRAIQTGLSAASGRLVVIQDADLEYSPADYQKLLAAFKEKQVVIYGSRNIAPKKGGYFRYVLGVSLLTRLVNFLFRVKLTDIYTCYKLFPLFLIKSLNLESRGFEFEAEVTVKVLKRGWLIKEIPINYQPRSFKQGKKIRFKDGLIGLATILKYWIKFRG